MFASSTPALDHIDFIQRAMVEKTKDLTLVEFQFFCNKKVTSMVTKFTDFPNFKLKYLENQGSYLYKQLHGLEDNYGSIY